MSHQRFDLQSLDDRQVLDRLLKLHDTSAEVMADLLCHLAEVERRELHVREGCATLFKYATEVLHCTEDEAWRRIKAARTGAKYRVIFEQIARGELTLTAVNLLAAVLTEENHRAVLAEAKHQSKARIEELVVRLAPKPDVAPRLVRLPQRFQQPAVAALPVAIAAPTANAAAPLFALTVSTPPPSSEPATVAVTAGTALTRSSPPPQIAQPERGCLRPLSPERWALTVTISTETRRAVNRALDLTRSRNPRGDLTLVVERALAEYTERLEARKAAKLRRGRASREGVVDATPEQPVALPRPEASPDVAAATPTSAATTALGTPPPAAAPTTVTAPTAAKALTAVTAATAPTAVTTPTAATPVAPDAPSPALAREPSSNGRRTREPTPEPCPSARPQHRPHIPRAVIREVRERDANQCAYVSPETGRRCTETRGLELHHVVPFARGGQPTASCLSLRCRRHNSYQAVLDFGAEHMAEAVRRRRRHSASERARERPRRRG